MRTSTCPHHMVRNVTRASISPANCSSTLEAPPFAEAGPGAVIEAMRGGVGARASCAGRVRFEQPVVHALFLVGQFNCAPGDAAAKDANEGGEYKVGHK